ncbi:MAG: polyribonucleotide nucleotidyltransferase, partial [Holosporales bacterium]|nr:polyribonucleotide nucleotidyltransferase [Holosporales bacterium]
MILMFSTTSESVTWGGKLLTIETGKIARQADGAVIARYGDTVVLCTVIYSRKQAKDASFFPLTVHYQDKFYAAGKIPGGFMKREGKPTERETLTSRLIDRAVRPLFPCGFLNEVQVVCTTLSYDPECPSDIVALIGASAALSISGVPFLGPVASCRVGYDAKGGFTLNPTKRAELDLVVAGTADGVLMVESEANELSEDTMLDAVTFGFESFLPIIETINKLAERIGKPTLAVKSFEEQYRDTLNKIESEFSAQIADSIGIVAKLERRDAIDRTRTDALSRFSGEQSEVVLNLLFESALARIMRGNLLRTKKRIDGREPDQIRPIMCEIDALPRVHGSALFTRGETQAMVVTTLGSSMDEQVIDDIDGERKQRFVLHYNFAPYSVGEIGKLGAPGRREIGHGKLALKSINPLVPPREKFPYAIRVVSDITESNGSSSMATVC